MVPVEGVKDSQNYVASEIRAKRIQKRIDREASRRVLTFMKRPCENYTSLTRHISFDEIIKNID